MLYLCACCVALFFMYIFMLLKCQWGWFTHILKGYFTAAVQSYTTKITLKNMSKFHRDQNIKNTTKLIPYKHLSVCTALGKKGYLSFCFFFVFKITLWNYYVFSWDLIMNAKIVLSCVSIRFHRTPLSMSRRFVFKSRWNSNYNWVSSWISYWTSICAFKFVGHV